MRKVKVQFIYLVKINLLLVIYLYSPFQLIAQNSTANHWHIGNGLHMDFSSGNPIFDTITSINSLESSVSYSSNDGTLLFYTNLGDIPGSTLIEPGTIWNRNHEIMLNGEIGDTCGCQSSLGGGVVIPDFTVPDIYYLYTTDCTESLGSSDGSKGLRFTTINMSLDGGLGGVVEKGVHVFGNADQYVREGLAVTKHNNGSDYWMVTHGQLDTFFVFLIEASGISGPFVNTVLSSGNGTEVKISPDGSWLTYGNELFQFDNGNGIISNPLTLGPDIHFTEFSSNSRYLYTNDYFYLFQYDLDAANIPSSSQLIYEIVDKTVPYFASMQLGPNCKIYLSVYDLSYVGTIDLPNLGGVACDVDPQKHDYSDFISGANTLVFPNLVVSDFDCSTADILHQESDELSIWVQYDQIIIEHLNNKSFTEYYIYSSTGSLIEQGMLEQNSNSIEISWLKSGIYILTLNDMDLYYRFVKQ